MEIIYATCLSYFLGSIPTAYLLSRLVFRKDIRTEGSGNVGTLNFLRITHAKFLSIIVLLFDAGKGYMALWISAKYIDAQYLIFSAVAVIIGHIFPVWLKGKGGRGLATLAGIFLFLEPLLVILWWPVFGVLYIILRKYIVAGILALVIVNITAGIFFENNTFLILSANSVIVMLKYVARLKEELIKS